MKWALKAHSIADCLFVEYPVKQKNLHLPYIPIYRVRYPLRIYSAGLGRNRTVMNTMKHCCADSYSRYQIFTGSVKESF